MNGSQANSRVASRIYAVLTNSAAGAVAIILFLLFLPVSVVNVSNIPGFLITNDLITTSIVLIFFVSSYIVGQMLQAFTTFVPFRQAVSTVLLFFPFIPKFSRTDVSESYKSRFSWACEHLFYNYEDVDKPDMYTPLNQQNIELATSYLRRKNVPQIQIYEEILSTFRQLEIVFTTCLVASVFLILPKNAAADGVQFSDLNLPVTFFVSGILFLALHRIVRWSDRTFDDIGSDQIDSNVDLNLFLLNLGKLLSCTAVVSVLLLISPWETNYNLNMNSMFGKWFKYSPFIFFILTYSTSHVKSRYYTMKMHTVIRDLYVVAISEGEIDERGK